MCPWENKEHTTMKKIPPKWNNDVDLTIDDVVIWEQIYHQPGNIGIYVAWSPNEEFYIVVYDLFVNTSAGIKIFKGPTAVDRILALASKLDINLPISRIQV